MRYGSVAFLSLMLGTGLCFAQAPTTVAHPETGSVPQMAPCSNSVSCSEERSCPTRFWIQGDYLLWWFKSGRLPVPVVTTGSINDANPGVLGQPNTRVLSPSDLEYGPASGARLIVGGWLDSDATFGLEASGFLLSQVGFDQSFASDPVGNPFLGRPIVLPDGTALTLQTAAEATQAGSLQLSSTSSLGGFEVNGVTGAGFGSVSLIGGFRYLRLAEDLSILESFRSLQNGINTFAAQPVPQDTLFHISDSFSTRNNFFGGQIGARYAGTIGRVTLGLQGKLGVGCTQQTLKIQGASAVDLPGGDRAVLPGGVLAQVSNIGSHRNTTFSLLPELGVDLGYQVTRTVSLRAGYQLLCWTNVLRPGRQLDPVVDLRQAPTDLSYTPGTRASQPGVLFQNSDFWAQGLSVGLNLSF